MKTRNHLPKHKAATASHQQGFILALALLMMLFIGIIVISSSNRTGTETRITQSRAHAATLEAAADAGVYTLRGIAQSTGEHGSASEACTAFMSAADLPGTANASNHLDDDETGVQIWWRWLPGSSDTASVCIDLNAGASARMVVEAWQGDQNKTHVVASLKSAINIIFDVLGCRPNDPDCVTPPHGDKTAAEVLEETFGEDAARANGNITVTGNATIQGSVASDSTSIQGGKSDITGGAFTYDGDNDPLKIQRMIDYMQLDDLSQNDASGMDRFAATESGITNQLGNAVVKDDETKKITFLSQEYTAMRLSELSVGGTNTVAGNVLMYVDGDVNLSNSTTFRMLDGASLVLITTGSINIGNFFKTEPATPVSANGIPTFALMTTTTSKVSMGRLDHMYGMIYAPNAEVDIGAAGSRFTGQIFADDVTLRANGSLIAFKQAFNADQLDSPSTPGKYVAGAETDIEFDIY